MGLFKPVYYTKNSNKIENTTMKKLILLLLCAVLLAGIAGTAMAEGRFCPWCGQEYDAGLGFAFCPNCGRELPKTETLQPAEEQETSSAVSIGDIVLFGSYEQDNDTADGKEGIEWIVLDVQEGKALLISRYALDCQQYNSTKTDITWEECTLRSWLNETFLNEAFSTEEQEWILTSEVRAEKNPDYSTNPGNDTMDKVFLLSVNEANQYFTSDSARVCRPTAYAEAQGRCYVNSDDGTSWWWLRSPGREANCAAAVYSDGSVDNYGNGVRSVVNAVRPALWINLEY